MQGTAERLLVERRRSRFTQTELATVSGIDRTYISKIENGRAGGVTCEVIEAIARSLEISPAWLVEWIGDEGILSGVKDDDAPAVDNQKPANDDGLMDIYIQLSSSQRLVVVGLCRLLLAEKQGDLEMLNEYVETLRQLDRG